jgi:hypothetical protein
MISQKLQIGQTLYSYSIDKDGSLKEKEHTITKVGRKFVEVGKYDGVYLTRTLKNKEFNPRYTPERLFTSKTNYLEWRELQESMKLIKDRFSGYGVQDLTLEQARKIKSILEEK